MFDRTLCLNRSIVRIQDSRAKSLTTAPIDSIGSNGLGVAFRVGSLRFYAGAATPQSFPPDIDSKATTPSKGPALPRLPEIAFIGSDRSSADRA